jgi:uncharacterized secreted protein with C-terminal beta-propeller domain
MTMDTPAKVTIGGIVTAGVLVTSAALVASDPVAPPAEATGLVPFTDCTTLRDWYVDHTHDEVGPYGWGGRMVPMMLEDSAGRMEPGTASDSLGGAKGEVANGPTGTNTQEVGVDEPDVAKTDGRVVVQLKAGRTLVITDVTGDRPRRLAAWQLPLTSYAEALLLVGDHVLLSSGQQPWAAREGSFAPSTGSTSVYDVDISDPTSPRLDDGHTWPGRQLSMRQYGDTVRLVTTLGLPSLRFVQPEGNRLGEDQAEQKNRAIVRASRIEDWIPGLGCGEVYHPQKWSGPDTVAVTTFRPGSVGDATKVAVTGAGSEVYSSTDRLYVTSTDWRSRPVPMDGLAGDGPTSSDVITSPASTRTHLHAFALDGDRTRYVASGTVAGAIRDRWSLDEHDGYLRVAVSTPSRTGATRDNRVVVLDEQGGRLEQVGELGGLGVGEEIQSVRWFDDLAVVVTFRQMDPLYTIDLSDPRQPRELGALKIPGFSAYLHPIGDDRLLGIGVDATTRGQSLGAQAAVFDISDLSDARQVGKVAFGEQSWFEAAEDPHAFTWLPGADAAVASLQHGSENTMVLLRVASDGRLSSEELGTVGGWGSRALPLPDGRVALVGNAISLVDVG